MITIGGIDLYDTAEAAVKIGVTDRTARRLAAKHQIGTQIGAAWHFSGEEIERLRNVARKMGNPKMVAGNELHRLRKTFRKK